jgi:hypothetical protein
MRHMWRPIARLGLLSCLFQPLACVSPVSTPNASSLFGRWQVERERDIVWFGILPIQKTEWRPINRTHEFVFERDGGFDFERSTRITPFVMKGKLKERGDRADSIEIYLERGYYEVTSASYEHHSSSIRITPIEGAGKLSGPIRVTAALDDDGNCKLHTITPRPLGLWHTHEYVAELRRVQQPAGSLPSAGSPE